MNHSFLFVYLAIVLALYPTPIRAADVNSEPASPLEIETEKNLTLEHCLELAAQYNPNLLQASTAFIDADGKAIGLRSILYPKAQALLISTPPTLYVQVEQVLVNRATTPRLKLGTLAREQAVVNYQQVLILAVYHTRQAFSLALARQQEIKLLQDYLSANNTTITRANQLFEAGKIQKTEISRLKVKFHLASQNLQSAYSAYHQALLRLGALMGRKIPEGAILLGQLGREDVPSLDLEKLTAEALKNRPDYQMLKIKKLAQDQQIVLATSSLYPVIGLTAKPTLQAFSLGSDYDLNRNDNEPSAQRSEGNTQIPVGIYLSWSLFDGGKAQGIQQSEQAQRIGQQEALEALTKSIPGEVRLTATNLETTQQILETLILSPSPEKLRQNAELDFNSGKIRSLDRLWTEDSILQQEQLILQTRLNYSLSASALDLILGRVVQFPDR